MILLLNRFFGFLIYNEYLELRSKSSKGHLRSIINNRTTKFDKVNQVSKSISINSADGKIWMTK